MTTPATQEGIAHTIGSLSRMSRGSVVVCSCLVLAVGAAAFEPSVALSQEPATEQTPADVVAQIGSAGPSNQTKTQSTSTAGPSNDTKIQSTSTDGQDTDHATQEAPWQPLLDDQLSQWEVFTGVPHKSVEIEGVPPSKSHDCRKGTPVGLGDPKNVYSVTTINGSPVLRVSGEVYAGLTTLKEHHDYHFSTEFKWGEKTWPPRRKLKRGSGILFHCTGKHGAFWNAWMRCIECQIQEGVCGDFISLAGTSCQIRTTAETRGKETPQHSVDGKWCTIGTGFGNWGAKRLKDHEIPGAWNRIEIHTVGDQAVFSVNGHRVMHLRNTRFGKRKRLQPLTAGKIQIQSEAAEVFYRDMKIRSIKTLPADAMAHYDDH